MADAAIKTCPKHVMLTTGSVITRHGDRFPALQDVMAVKHPCDMCPVRKYCGDNAPFDCHVYEMFSGFYAEDEYSDLFTYPFAVVEALKLTGSFM